MTNETTQENVGTHWVGLDVSKDKFDAGLARRGQSLQTTPLMALPAEEFARTPEGVRAFVEWLDALLEDPQEGAAVRGVMEATGRYSTELAVWLVQVRPSLAPAIEPPRQTAAFLKSLGLRNVTDALAARALAVYGRERQPRAYRSPSPAEQELRDVCRYRDTLVQQRTAAANHAGETTSSPFVRSNQDKRIRLLDADIARAQAELRRLVSQIPELQRDIALLSTLYGVGFLTAAVVRAELGDLRRFEKARQLNAFAGLNPAVHQSGTSVHHRTHLSKRGNARVRQALYLASMVAIQGQNDLQRTYCRLVGRGKSRMAALGAVMRKMLCVMRAVLISGKPYEPDWKLSGKLNHASP